MSAPTFRAFAMAIQAGDTVEAGGSILSKLLDVSDAAGELAASYFNSKLEFEPDLFSEVMQIRKEILEGRNNDALLLIEKCFKLRGLEGLQALESMRKLA